MGRAFELTGFFPEGVIVLAVNCSDDPNELGEALCLKLGAAVSVTYSQLKNKRWKFSLRSRGETDVSALAAKYPNGGGHPGAAGFELPYLPMQFQVTPT